MYAFARETADSGPSGAADETLQELAGRLAAAGYRFTTVTPETHRRVLARPATAGTPDLRDIFGWNRPFVRDQVDPAILSLMEQAGILREAGQELASAVRFSTRGALMFLHSAYPTRESNAVFFGPDTYRFLQFIETEVANLRAPRRMADIGTGSGAAALALAQRFPEAWIVAADINREALRFCVLNAAINDIGNVEAIESDVAQGLSGSFDLIVANPPYLVDPLGRQYRHGGGALGADLSLRILREGVARLTPRGRLLLYTGSAVVDGVDSLRAAATAALANTPWHVIGYHEIDPDVFGEELESPAYARADRIAAVGLVAGWRSRLVKE